jgi:hypothetical protein
MKREDLIERERRKFNQKMTKWAKFEHFMKHFTTGCYRCSDK